MKISLRATTLFFGLVCAAGSAWGQTGSGSYWPAPRVSGMPTAGMSSPAAAPTAAHAAAPTAGYPLMAQAGAPLFGPPPANAAAQQTLPARGAATTPSWSSMPATVQPAPLSTTPQGGAVAYQASNHSTLPAGYAAPAAAGHRAPAAALYAPGATPYQPPAGVPLVAYAQPMAAPPDNRGAGALPDSSAPQPRPAYSPPSLPPLGNSAPNGPPPGATRQAAPPTMAPAPQPAAPYSLPPGEFGATIAPYGGGGSAMYALPPAGSPPDAAWGAAPPANGGLYQPGGSFDAAIAGGSGGCATCDNCATCGPCGACGSCNQWFVSLAGLYMTRDNPNNVTLTAFAGEPNRSVLGSSQAGFEWYGGGEAHIGRTLGETFALEGVYWSLEQFDEAHGIRSPNDDLISRLDFGTLSSGGTLFTDIFNNSRQHLVQRTNEFHNIEINLLHQSAATCGPCGFMLFGGARFFRFDEQLVYGAAAGGTEFGDAGGANSGFYNVRALNQLIGGQLGARGQVYLGRWLRLHATPRFGVFANVADVRQQLYLGNGGSAVNLKGEKTDVALLGQIDLGSTLYLGHHWSLYATYRAMVVGGVALSDDQIPTALSDFGEMNTVNSAGNLILHGAVIGVQCVF